MTESKLCTAVQSSQVSWWSVHEHVTPLLEMVGSWPMVGTAAWCALDDRDPVKKAAVYDAARHHALRVETAQAALAEASRAISDAADWSAIADDVRRRAEFYAARPWMRRVKAR